MKVVRPGSGGVRIGAEVVIEGDVLLEDDDNVLDGSRRQWWQSTVGETGVVLALPLPGGVLLMPLAAATEHER